MADMISYTWEILEHRSLNPDDFRGARTFIETERGTYPGKAVLLFRDEIASEIMGDEGPLTITVRKWVFSDDEWTEEDSYEFKDYYPVHSRVPDGMDHTVVEVTLKDARKLLSDVMVQRRFNVIIEVLDEDSDDFIFEESTTNGGSPWTLGEIFEELFALSPDAPTVSITDSSIPTNIVFQNESLASAIEKLLALKGLAYVYELGTGTATTANLQSAGSRSGIDTAIADKRLKWDFSPEIEQPLEVELLKWDAKEQTSPITQLAWDEHSTAAGQPKKVVIQHFHPKIAGLVPLAQAWYAVLESPLDQIFQGIVEQEITAGLTHARFWYENGETSTRFQNKLQKEIPWPTPPVSVYLGGDSGSVTGIATGVGTETNLPLVGLKYADVFVIESSDPSLVGESIRIHDRKGCIFDIDVTGFTVWAHKLWARTMDLSKDCNELVQYWSADDRCCEPDTAIYRDCV
ncbi:hypothetical protein SH449x_004127 [Pirellulaceae bacterium SH449]